MNFKTTLDRYVWELVNEGAFIRHLIETLNDLGIVLPRSEVLQIQKNMMMTASSWRTDANTKLNVLEKEIEEMVLSAEKIGEWSMMKRRNSETRDAPCLTSKLNEVKNRPKVYSTHTAKLKINEVKWDFRTATGLPVARLQRDGQRILLFGFGKGLLGWYHTTMDWTMDVKGRMIGRGNVLGMLLR